MIVNKEKCRFGATDLLLIAAACLFAVGIRLWFPVCGGMEGSTVTMSCHWAGEALKAVSILLAALCVVHLLTPDGKMKAGMDVALAGLSVLAMLLPGNVISICAGAEMACRAKTMAASIACGAALLVLALADLFYWLSRAAAQKHRRNV